MRESMQRRLNVLGDVLYVVKNLRMVKRIQSGDAVTTVDIRKEMERLFKTPGLTREQVRQVRSYFHPYKVSTLTHREVMNLTGEFRPEVIPMEMFYAYIDPYLNNRTKAAVLEHKCLFYRLFPGIPKPEPIAFRMNGFWLTPDYQLISKEEAFAEAERCGTVFVKKAEDSCGGHGVTRVRANSDGEGFAMLLEKALEGMDGDILLQKPISQHEDLKRLNPASVNTYRISTLLTKDGPQHMYSFARFGLGDTPVDNYSSGGLVCGVNEEGKLRRFAYSHSDRFEEHPVSGVRFEGYVLPSYFEAFEMAKKAHLMMPSSRLAFWDLAVDEDGKPMLIEANLCEGGFVSPQITNGPMFTGDKRPIVDEALKDSDFPRYLCAKRA